MLSENATRLYAAFFEELGLCKSGGLPDVRIYSRKGARILTGILLADGITLGRSIYVHPRFISRDASGRLVISKNLLAHELVHVIQYSNQGIRRFLTSYISYFWREFRERKKWNARTWYEAYLLIPHEIEARETAAKFGPWLESRDSSY